MIKDTIIYKKQVILTIYHQGFADEKGIQKRCIKEHINQSCIYYEEQYAKDDEWAWEAYSWENTALLTPKEKCNPYRDKACANMTHRIRMEKPTVIWKTNGKTIAGGELQQIIDFVKRYTGMDLQDKPVYLGDAFLFSPSEISYHCTKENGIAIKALKAGMTVIIQFKDGDSILDTHMLQITHDTPELVISTSSDWNNHDIEIYEKGQLIFRNAQNYYIRNISLSFSVTGRTEKIPLNTLQPYYEIKHVGQEERTLIGKAPEEQKETNRKRNAELVRELTLAKRSQKFIFIRPGERNIALEKIAKLICDAKDEIWLIDSYFSDKGEGCNQMIDWLRIFASSRAAKKYVLFYCKKEESAYSAAQLKEIMKNDTEIKKYVRPYQNSGKITLLQAKAPIHDRFVLVRSKDAYEGLSIGTSFNSLNSNHYCIHTLSHSESKEVLETLTDWMERNICAREEL